ncbi:MAG: fibronectin type III domain-containing protein, partial [Thermoplasmata archaeon]|nr:fibronectin type III domain-containing protein [Thermoplasmata archaeon]
PNGWLKLGWPVLKDPGDVDPDGNYTVAWDLNPRAVGYILEEDETPNFESPTEIFNGLDSKVDIINKAEGIYYYRLKAYKDDYISNWSNVVDIIVDFIPQIPRKFKAVIHPEGNAINLTWELNTDETKYYELEYKDKIYSGWVAIGKTLHPINYFEHTDLENYNTYFYRIRANDSINQTSKFSKEINGTPEDSTPPSAPEDLVAQTISDTEVALTWAASPEPDVAGYIVYMKEPREADSSDFEVVGTINDLKTSFSVNGLNEQTTYQFRVVSFDEVPLYSPFSILATCKTIDITPPETPLGLMITNTSFNTLELSWTPNKEPDVIGYYVFRSTSSIGNFKQQNSESITENQYTDTGLNESTTYYYKIQAEDDFGLKSGFSQIISGTTDLGPYPPEINNSINDIEILEDRIDDLSINLYYLFKDINGDTLTFDHGPVENINITIYQENGTVILVPDHDWNGEVTVTFYASDGVYTISEDINIWVSYVNDLPHEPEITSPPNDLTIAEGEPLTLRAVCDDPDLIYGDSLSYTWHSNISGILGRGQELKDIELESGYQIITVEVMDSAGQKAVSSVTVMVEGTGSAEVDKENNNMTSMIILTSTIVLIFVLVLFIYFKKKRSPTIKDDGKEIIENINSANNGPNNITPAMPAEQLNFQNPIQSQVQNYPPMLYNNQPLQSPQPQPPLQQLQPLQTLHPLQPPQQLQTQQTVPQITDSNIAQQGYLELAATNEIESSND